MENRNFEQARELHQSGRLQEAFNEYQQILTLNPDHEGATFGQGLIFLQSNRFSEAIQMFEHAIKLNPNNSEYIIKINQKEYRSESFSNIYDLYEYKKNLMLDGIISPIANNKVTQNTIVNFTPIKSDDLSDSHVFPYKSTWITPRFDS